MATSAFTLMEIIDLTHKLSLEGKTKQDIMVQLDNERLLPRKYASNDAKWLADAEGLSLELAGGSGTNGTYTIADVRLLINKGKQLKKITPHARAHAENLGIDIETADIKGTGKDGTILVCDVLDFVQRDTDKDTEKDSDKDTMKLDED